MIIRSSATAAAILASAVLLPTAAPGADGEILIDQARVNAGGITPGDAPGFPATLRRPGRYKLAGNLRVPAGREGIEVTQHDVTIDLNGFTISSNPPGEAGQGVNAEDMRGLRVMNGTITGFQTHAIWNDGLDSAFAAVENMRIVNNGGGVVLGNDSRVRNSTLSDNGFGIGCRPRCVIEQNVVTGAGNNGIVVDGAGAVIGNLIVSNGSVGLVFGFLLSSGYGNNILFGNNGGGAQVSGAAVQLHPNVCAPACP